MHNKSDGITGPHETEGLADGGPGAQSAAAEEYVRSTGAELVKLEGRVMVRFSGMAEGTPYDLVPADGVLANAKKWRNMSPEDQLALVTERVHARAADNLQRKVRDFVAEVHRRAEEHGVDPEPFLKALAVKETAVPVNQVFDRIEQRIGHAVERQQEERHAARTKESINLAEYPASFELAWRLPRRFIALLGPTNSGKTHEAMEALARAESGVYLAPLRLLALENYERLQSARPDGREIRVNLVTGEERREV